MSSDSTIQLKTIFRKIKPDLVIFETLLVFLEKCPRVVTREYSNTVFDEFS